MKIFNFCKNSTGLLLAIFVLSFTIHAQDWTGEYFFEEDGGETAGGTKIYIAHSLNIQKTGESLEAHVFSQGFQTSNDIFASAEKKDGKLSLYFQKYGPDQTFGTLKKGELIFSLEIRDEKLITIWASFKPVLDDNLADGKVRFIRNVEDDETTLKTSLLNRPRFHTGIWKFLPLA